MQKIIRIGTRDSELALWQAEKVQKLLEQLKYSTQIVPIKSTGDINLDKPLYELGITGIFTKNLDTAMLKNEIDIAVHSMKDVPTVLPEGITQAAVLKRANFNDILVLKGNEEFLAQPHGIIATSSLRRKAQWLNRYPSHTVEDIRGNVSTRLQKVIDNNWNGAIFAAAGLERIGKKPKGAIPLSWMIPAPAQGTIMITALSKNEDILEICKQLNDSDTEICTSIEREFLNLLEGGCTAPIGALATIDEVNKEINFKGVLLSRNGRKKIEIQKKVPIYKRTSLAKDCATYITDRRKKLFMMEDLQVEKEFSVYSTKKLSEAQKKLISTSIKIEDSDFIKIRFNRIAPKIIKEKINHVIITSKNGIEALLHNFTEDQLQFKNIYCVGRRTKKLIEQKIGKVPHYERNAARLATYLINEISDRQVTYFCSDLRLDTLPKTLNENNITVNEIIAYKTMYSPEKIDTKINGVLFFSPSTVKSYMQKNNANKIAFCIGESTAREARKYFETVQVAGLPTAESIIEMINIHFVKK